MKAWVANRWESSEFQEGEEVEIVGFVIFLSMLYAVVITPSGRIVQEPAWQFKAKFGPIKAMAV